MIDPRAAGPRSVVDDEGWGFILRIVAAFTRPQGTEKNENAWFDFLMGGSGETSAPVFCSVANSGQSPLTANARAKRRFT